MDYNVSLTPLAGSSDTFTAMFPGGTNIFTFQVQIIDDSVFEGREDFTLKLDVENIVRSREGIRLVHPNTTAITIVDDESESASSCAVRSMYIWRIRISLFPW